VVLNDDAPLLTLAYNLVRNLQDHLLSLGVPCFLDSIVSDDSYYDSDAQS
jgi:hypothetical protein